MIWFILAAVSEPVSCCGPLLFDDQPTGDVNPVCWKLLAIAGLGFTILGGVIVVLARLLWTTATGRTEDLRSMNKALKEREEG